MSAKIQVEQAERSLVSGTITVEIGFEDVPVDGMEPDGWDRQVERVVRNALTQHLLTNIKLSQVYEGTCDYRSVRVNVPFHRFESVAEAMGTPDGGEGDA